MLSLPINRYALGIVVGVTLTVVGWGAPAAHNSTLVAAPGHAECVVPVDPAADVERVDLARLEQLMREGTVVVVDVRPYNAYLQAHLPGAVSIPLDQLERALPKLKASNAHVVFYCAGEAAVKSGRAATTLLERGFTRVYCLDGGFDRWVASGRVVVVQPTDT